MGDRGSTPSTSSNAAPAEVHGYGGMTIEECQEKIQKSFSDPKVKTLLESLEQSRFIKGRNFIRAINCKENYSGQYDDWSRKIELCSNNLNSEEEVLSTLTHELIHAYDHCRSVLTRNNSACSEIRAYRLDGGCHIMKRGGFLHRYLGFLVKPIEKECVKQGANTVSSKRRWLFGRRSKVSSGS